jgi:hypothetical protein
MVSAHRNHRNRSLEIAPLVNGPQLELEHLNRNTSPINEVENNDCEVSTSTDPLKLAKGPGHVIFSNNVVYVSNGLLGADNLGHF